jgi:hypothetical protein
MILGRVKIMETLFKGCEDPELVDIEMEIPPDEFGMLSAEEMLPEIALDFDEFNELGGLQEEFEAAFLEGASIEEEFEFSAVEDEFPMIEELEPLQMEETSPLNLEALITSLKKYPGLKITFSF